MANNFSRLVDKTMRYFWEKAKIGDAFPYEHVLATSHDLIQWFAYIANYLESDFVPSDLTFHKIRIMHDVKKFFWDEPYIYQSYADVIIHHCVPDRCWVLVRHVIPLLWVETIVVSELRIKSFSVGIIDPPSTKMLTISLNLGKWYHECYLHLYV